MAKASPAKSASSTNEAATHSSWATRDNSRLFMLAAATLSCLGLCLLLLAPFLPALVWSLTVAVVTHRPWRWLRGKIKSPSLAAGIATGAVALTVLLPIIVLSYFIAAEVVQTVQGWQQDNYTKQIQDWLAGYPRISQYWNRVSTQIDFSAAIQEGVQRVQTIGTAIFSGVASTVAQAVLMLFILFFLYRDEETARDAAHRFSPLDNAETDNIFSKLADTIHATVYGSLVVAMVQGTLGGVIFTILGVPGAVLWAATMGLLAMVPYLGTFIIWAPTAVILALTGHWIKACILLGWGIFVIGTIDNLLYPTLVGTRLRRHTVVSFIAILGGVSLFGTTGIILGPLLVTMTFALLAAWRHKTPPAAEECPA